MSLRTSWRAILTTLATHLFLSGLKWAAALLTRSAAMLAEAIHSTTSALHQLLLLLGVKNCEKRADEIHPFGFSLDSFYWSFMAAIFLYTAGALVAIAEGARRLRHMVLPSHTIWAISVLALSLILLFIIQHAAQKPIRKEKGRSGLFTHLRRTKRSELAAAFGENLSGLVSMTVTLGLLIAAHASGNPLFDALASLFVGALMAATAVWLGFESRFLLIGESASPELLRRIYRLVRQDEAIRRVIHVRSLKFGPEDILLAVRVEFDPHLNSGHIANLIEGLDRDIRSKFPEVKKTFIESALGDPGKPARIS